MQTNEVNESMANMVKQIVEAFVDAADEVRVTLSVDAQGEVTIALFVAPGDVGKVIGKQGRMARALRMILGAASMKSQVRFALDIVETGARDAHHSREPQFSEETIERMADYQSRVEDLACELRKGSVVAA